MSTELQQIRSELRHDRLILRLVVSVMVVYAAACTGLTMMQLAQL